MKHCCERFKKETGELQAMAGGGFMYPPDMRPNAQIELDTENETWNVNGCCGGGCYVLEGLKFCPWCGSALQFPERNSEK